MTDRNRVSNVFAIVLTPRWLLALFAALLFAAACIPLGLWQWTRTQDIVQSERASLEAPVDVLGVTVPGQLVPRGDIGRTVTAEGTYDAADQIFITSRMVDRKPGVWVWTPLVLSDGSSVGVVRGWLADVTAPGAEPPEGRVSLSGVLYPDEGFYADAPMSGDQALAIDSLRFGNSGTRGGFIMLEEQSPQASDSPVPIPPSAELANVAFPLRNFFYSFQWWVFGAFALVAWAVLAWREIRDQAGTVAPHEPAEQSSREV